MIPETQGKSSEYEQLVQTFSEDFSKMENTSQNLRNLDDCRRNYQTASVSRQCILPKLHSLPSDTLPDSTDFVTHEGKENLILDLQRVILSKGLHQGKGGFDSNLKLVQGTNLKMLNFNELKHPLFLAKVKYFESFL